MESGTAVAARLRRRPSRSGSAFLWAKRVFSMEVEEVYAAVLAAGLGTLRAVPKDNNASWTARSVMP
ncbi:MAG: hypothetical protein K6U03_10325 [Firmicutes bacterium]|nr:hypothetical protein [Bacillota bacterium]